MSTSIRLKVPGKVTQEVVSIDPVSRKEKKEQRVVEFVSHGEFDAELKPNSLIETKSRKFADWLIAEYGLKEIKPDATGDDDEAENVFEQQYPADFPKREIFIKKEIAFETAQNLDRDGLIKIDGIAGKTADSVLKWFEAHPVENIPPTAPSTDEASGEGNKGDDQ